MSSESESEFSSSEYEESTSTTSSSESDSDLDEESSGIVFPEKVCVGSTVLQYFSLVKVYEQRQIDRIVGCYEYYCDRIFYFHDDEKGEVVAIVNSEEEEVYVVCPKTGKCLHKFDDEYEEVECAYMKNQLLFHIDCGIFTRSVFPPYEKIIRNNMDDLIPGFEDEFGDISKLFNLKDSLLLLTVYVRNSFFILDLEESEGTQVFWDTIVSKNRLDCRTPILNKSNSDHLFARKNRIDTSTFLLSKTNSDHLFAVQMFEESLTVILFNYEFAIQGKVDCVLSEFSISPMKGKWGFLGSFSSLSWKKMDSYIDATQREVLVVAQEKCVELFYVSNILNDSRMPISPHITIDAPVTDISRTLNTRFSSLSVWKNLILTQCRDGLLRFYLIEEREEENERLICSYKIANGTGRDETSIVHHSSEGNIHTLKILSHRKKRVGMWDLQFTMVDSYDEEDRNERMEYLQRIILFEDESDLVDNNHMVKISIGSKVKPFRLFRSFL